MNAMLHKLRKTGFFHIFTTQVLNKIIGVCSGLLIVRILSQQDYGVYSFANNVIATFLLLGGMGTISGMLQMGSEEMNNPAKRDAYFRYGFRGGSLFNLLMMVAVIIYALFFPISIQGAQPYILLLCLMPAVVYCNDTISTRLRVEMRNKEYSFFNTLTAALVCIATLGGAFFGIGAVISLRYIAYILLFFIVAKMVKGLFGFFKQPVCLTRQEKKTFWKISIISALNNGISQLLFVIDIWFVGEMTRNADILASYKTATLIPFALVFVPLSIVTYVYPYFAAHRKDLPWVRAHYAKLLLGITVLNAVLSALMYFLAPYIVEVFFGAKYADCVPIFRLLAIGYFITATFRIPSGNILVMLQKVRVNLIVCIASGVVNILLNIWLIGVMGAMGAAVATVGVYFFSGLCSTGYLLWVLYGKGTGKKKAAPALPAQG